jgi:hypothetical protein
VVVVDEESLEMFEVYLKNVYRTMNDEFEIYLNEYERIPADEMDTSVPLNNDYYSEEELYARFLIDEMDLMQAKIQKYIYRIEIIR